MAFTITLIEIFDMLIMTLATGYIFMDAFKKPVDDPVTAFSQSSWKERFGYAMLLVAPPLILHELAHKFTAVFYGLTATFHAAYMWLGLGVILKLISFPFLFLVPAYVSIIGSATPVQSALIAFAGPLVHLLIFITAWSLLKFKTMKASTATFWQYTKFINGFLFIFNMIPIPGFDGSKVFAGIIGLF